MTNATKKTLTEHFDRSKKNKRILSLDGGGVKGILTIAHLEKIESLLKKKYGDDDSFRLCDHFDLIAGTSTGAIIAACLAIGWKVSDIRKKYFSLSENIFKKNRFRKGLFRAKYDKQKLIEELKEVFGEKTTLSSKKIKTGLLIITKRLDTNSPWPLSNNPKGKYFRSKNKNTIDNADYLLWKVVRASTAAPVFFQPEEITIASSIGINTVTGAFVDGGVSPYNNPALMALMYVTLKGYNIEWSFSKNEIELISLGTGYLPTHDFTDKKAFKNGVNALLSLMDDSATLQETILQWMSSSPTARSFDREIGDLSDDLITDKPLFKYLRYDVNFDKDEIIKLDPKFSNETKVEKLSEMDSPENMELLYEIGELSAEKYIDEKHYKNPHTQKL